MKNVVSVSNSRSLVKLVHSLSHTFHTNCINPWLDVQWTGDRNTIGVGTEGALLFVADLTEEYIIQLFHHVVLARWASEKLLRWGLRRRPGRMRIVLRRAWLGVIIMRSSNLLLLLSNCILKLFSCVGSVVVSNFAIMSAKLKKLEKVIREWIESWR